MIAKLYDSHWVSALRVLLVCACMVTSGWPSLCRAGFNYSLGFGQAGYSGSSGQTVEIELYIRELVTDGSIPRFAFGNNDGLLSIGATIIYSADFGTAATITSASAVALEPAFDGLEVVATPAENKLEITSLLSPATLPFLETNPDPSNPNLYAILIGRVTFQMGNTLGNTTIISIDKRELAGMGAIDNNLIVESAPGFFEQLNIDDIIQGSSTTLTNVAAVPEPSSLWLVAIPLLFKRRKKGAGLISYRSQKMDLSHN